MAKQSVESRHGPSQPGAGEPFNPLQAGLELRRTDSSKSKLVGRLAESVSFWCLPCFFWSTVTLAYKMFYEISGPKRQDRGL
ncbi:hypothetical protein MHYP_G00261460 [Metynnis hypsauchen]